MNRYVKAALTGLFMATTLAGAAKFYLWQTEQDTEQVTEQVPSMFWEQVKPLADLVALGEGSWNSVNRGYPGDTPGGIQTILRKPFSEVTLNEIIAMQDAGEIFAVGKFQFIPSTFRSVVKASGLSYDTKFTNDVQYQLFAVTLESKRPVIGDYLKGYHSHLDIAADELAMEWAGVEYREGRGFYDGYNGNKAKVKRSVVEEVMQAIWNTNVTP